MMFPYKPFGTGQPSQVFQSIIRSVSRNSQSRIPDTQILIPILDKSSPIPYTLPKFHRAKGFEGE
jgi:hypothetical protein